MCYNSKEKFIKNFKQFENNLPIIKEESIDFPLKKLIYIIKEKIEGTIKEGENKYFFDFLKEKSLPIKFNLIINYEVDEETDYSGGVDYNEVSKNNFNNFNLYIKAKDKEIDYSSIYSTIGHELKHVFDIYLDRPYMMADKMKYIYYLMNKYKDKYLQEMLYLAYISLRYEMEARNSEIYNKLRWLKTFDNLIIMDEFKKSYIFKCLEDLNNFNPNEILSNVNPKLLTDFLNEYKLIYDVDYDINKIKNFFFEIQRLFQKISEIYLNKALDVIEELKIDNRPYMEAKKHPFYYEYLYLMKVNKDVSESVKRIKVLINKKDGF
jgi:hypothetical protein